MRSMSLYEGRRSGGVGRRAQLRTGAEQRRTCYHMPRVLRGAACGRILHARRQAAFTHAHARACARGHGAITSRAREALFGPPTPSRARQTRRRPMGRLTNLVPVDAAFRVTTVPLEHQSNRRNAIAGRAGDNSDLCEGDWVPLRIVTGAVVQFVGQPEVTRTGSSDALEQPLQLSCHTVYPLQFRIVPAPATSTRVGLGRACSRPPPAAVVGSPHMSWLPGGYTSEFPTRVFAATRDSLCRLPARFFSSGS